LGNNITACYSVAKLTLKLLRQIFLLYNIAPQAVCDDFLDIDGNNNVNNVNEDCYFDLSATKITIKIYYQQQPVVYNINYYRNQVMH
jgi:hypothetical protein